ncbi:MAG TPA: exodeoxyribonuclease III [Gammaproteobacteria bacterium]|nr:exodeoxyribonuclease III [Gammaproteobacteria bacterium]
MRVITFNANGLRSAARKGFFDWFARQRADVLCVQEIKAHAAQLAGSPFERRGYHRYIGDAVRPGYSGVALYTREQPLRVVAGLGSAEFDAEGRYLEAQFKDLAVVSVYLPSGSSGEARQEAKFRFLDLFERHLATLRRRSTPYILCGDFNIAHRPIDLKNWRGNQKNSGFLPEERAWMENLLTKGGYVDAFRAVNQEADQYTWWSNRGRAREKNVGWRIDYHVVSKALKSRVRRAAIYKNRFFSDHAPLTIDYEL